MDYIILGDNNFWYASLFNVSKKEAMENLKIVEQQIDDNEFTDSEPYKPEELFLYEAKKIATRSYTIPEDITEEELSEQLHGVNNRQ